MSVIDRWHDLHPEACAQCRKRAFTWSPDTDQGILVTSGARVVERSEAVRKLLVP